MDSKYSKAVRKAVEMLEVNPKDEGHNLKHHQVVWNNCQRLIKKEKLRVKEELVKVAAFWHDISLKEREKDIGDVEAVDKYLKNYLPTQGFTGYETRKVTEAVRFHEFRSVPINKEGMILQDADKLDAISLERGLNSYRAYKNGKFDRNKLINYADTFIKWLPIIKSSFHYESSKRLAEEEIAKIIKNTTIANILKELGLSEEFDKAKKEIAAPSPRTRLVILIIILNKYRSKILAVID